MKALVTGATGFVGQALVRRLERPVVLTRDPPRARVVLGAEAEVRSWDPERPLGQELFDGVEAVFHLAGEPVAEGRWDQKKKERIRSSRVVGTRRIVEAMRRSVRPPRVFVCASAIGYYGDRADEPLDEAATTGKGFLAEVCRSWEEEAMRAASFGTRVVALRIGLVLGPGGGALKRMLFPFKLGLGGRLGSGRQWMSWIHLDDLVELSLYAASCDRWSGRVNAVAPEPVTNRLFTRTLASVLGRPAFFPVPSFALRLALGEFATALLSSQRVLPRSAEQGGYRFRYPSLEGALRNLLG
jgi:uncharacterized protein (TIGR01777 family)